MPEGNVVKIPDFALESTAQQMLKQLSVLDQNNSKAHAALLKQAQDDAKNTEKFRKDDESDREDLYKATLDIAKAVREQSKASADKPGLEGISVGAELPQTLTRLAQGANTTATHIDNVGQSAGVSSEAIENMGDTSDAAREQLDKFNKSAAVGEKAFVMFYDSAMTTAKTLVGAAVVYGGLLLDSFTGLGEQLNNLTREGVGFTDGLSSGGMSATGAMMELSGMGLNAVSTLSTFSSVVQSMGKGPFVQLTESFKDATNAGVDLGMSLEDSVSRMGAEMQKRQLMGALDGVNQQRLQKTITTSIRNQQKYSAALGVSTDELVAFTDSLLNNTPALTANLMRLNADLRNQVIGGITDFGTAMRGLGGEEGGAIAEAMTEAAASGAMGFSESMTGYITALPSLAGPMNDYISAIQNGTLSQEDADQMAQDIATQLGNVSAAEKNRIFALARAGDAQAESMAKAIAQFEQSEKKLKDMNKGFEMSEVQKGTNMLTKIVKEFTGTFEAMKTGFLVGFASVGDAGETISESLKEAQKIIVSALGDTFADVFGGTGDAFTDLTDGAKGFGAQLGKKLPDMIKSVAESVAGFIKDIPSIVDSVKSFVSGFMSVMKVVGMVISPVISVFKFLAGVIETLASVVGFVLTPFTALGSWLGGFLGDTADKAGGFANILGKLTGIAITLFGAFKLASGVMFLFGKSMPSMFANMGKSMMEGAKNMMSGLGNKINKATGGKLDQVFGKAKEKLTGKAKEMDMGSKAMDSATKKSKSFTKTLATGMKDISKGVSNMLTNLSKGISNSVSNISKGIQKGISALSKGIADAGKGIGTGIGGLLKGTLTGLGQGLQVLGNPKVLLGVAALTGIGAAMFVAGKAFQQFADINWAGVAAGAVALGILGGAAALIAPFAVPMAIGAAAIGALGLALVPFAAAVKIAAPAMVELMGSFKLLNEVDPKNLLLLGPGLVSLAAGMAAFSAGGLIGSVLDGLGKLFGSDSPFDKLAKIGVAAPAIVQMTDNMNNMGQTVDNFNSAIEQLDGKAAGEQFGMIAKGIDKLNESMDNINMMDLVKMAAMKTFGPIRQELEPEQEALAGVNAEYGDDITEPTGPTVNKMDIKPRAEMNAYERKRARQQRREETMARGGIAAGVSEQDAQRARAQAPQVAALNNPTAASAVDTQTATKTVISGTDDPIAQSMSRTGSDQNSLTDALERMVAKQEQTNALLKKGNRISSDGFEEF